MLIFALYTLGVFVVGFLFGATVKLIIDKDALRQLEEEKRALHRENENLKKSQKVERIEIIDERVPDVTFGGF